MSNITRMLHDGYALVVSYQGQEAVARGIYPRDLRPRKKGSIMQL